jgi:two-component system, OmpR family, copper resistance phosphate regulon response regulator CusR
MKLLVVEDEETTAAFLRRGLTEEGWVVDVATDGDRAREAVAVYDYDAILLDVMLPGEDGFSLCRRWRAEGLTLPILFLTARDEIADRVEGLNLGADDYLVKPFAFEELLARVRALLRRGRNIAVPAEIRIGDLVIDTNRRRVERDGKRIPMTAREYQLLEYLARNAGKIVTRTALWDHVWESGAEPDSNVVDVYVRYLRNKLGRAPDLIETVRGAGYVLDAGSTAQQEPETEPSCEERHRPAVPPSARA